MKLLKLASLMSALALFVLACDSTNTPNTNTGSAQPSPAASNANNTRAAASPSPLDQFARSKEIYGQECSFCHGDEGKGGVVKIEDKQLKVPSLLKGHALNHTEEQLAKQIREGGDGMPAFKDKMTEEEITQMVRYIREKLQAGAATGTPPAKPAASPAPSR
jgi:mono/diheme cytochrome c family protein